MIYVQKTQQLIKGLHTNHSTPGPKDLNTKRPIG